jgi:hypothetical protein
VTASAPRAVARSASRRHAARRRRADHPAQSRARPSSRGIAWWSGRRSGYVAAVRTSRCEQRVSGAYRPRRARTASRRVPLPCHAYRRRREPEWTSS